MRTGRNGRPVPHGYIRKSWCDGDSDPDAMICEDGQYMLAEDGVQMTIE